MKKLIQLFVIAMIFVMGTQAAFANSDEETIQKGADLTQIHRLALGASLYIPRDKEAPTKANLEKVFDDATKVSHANIVSYNTIADNINSTKNVDILALDRRTAAKIYKENVADFADAYVILTVANNSRTTFFFDVYKSGTNELLYTYEISTNRNEKDSDPVFKTLCEQFYKHFDRAVMEQVKGMDKAKKGKKSKKEDNEKEDTEISVAS